MPNTQHPYDAPYGPPQDFSPQPPPAGPSRVGVALVCLHIGAAIYLLLGLAAPLVIWLASSGGQGNADFVAVVLGSICFLTLCLGLVAAIEIVAYGIRRRTFWGWIGGLVVFGLFAPSAFFPLGILGLWGLLAQGSRAEFPIGGPAVSPRERR